MLEGCANHVILTMAVLQEQVHVHILINHCTQKACVQDATIIVVNRRKDQRKLELIRNRKRMLLPQLSRLKRYKKKSHNLRLLRSIRMKPSKNHQLKINHD